MRYTITIILFFCLFIKVNGQEFILYTGGKNEDNYVKDVYEYKSSYFFDYPIIDTSINFAHHKFVKTNLNGAIIKSIQLDSIRVISSKVYDDGIYFMAGKLVSNAVPEYSSFIFKLDENLNIVKQKELYGPNTVNVGYDFIKYSPDTFIYAGWHFDSQGGSVFSNDYIILLDSNFQIIYADSSQHTNFHPLLNRPHLLNIPNDSDIYIAGIPYQDAQYNYYDLVLPIKRSTFKIQPPDTVDYFTGLPNYDPDSIGGNTWNAVARNHTLVINDSTFLMSADIGYNPTVNINYMNPGFIKLDKNFNPLNMYDFNVAGNKVSKTVGVYGAFDMDSKGNLYLTGTYNCNSIFSCRNVPGTKIFVVKTDINGSLKWEKVFGEDTLLYVASNVKATSDGGVLVCAMITDTTINTNYDVTADVVVIKLDSMGTVVKISKLEVSKNLLSVFPNPTSGKLYIDINFEETTSMDLIITNMLGEQVFTKSLRTKFERIEVDLANYPNGVYLVSLVTPNQISTQKIILNK